MIINRSHSGDFYGFSSLVNFEKKKEGGEKNASVLLLPDLTAAFIGCSHEHTFVAGTGDQAALDGCVNTRDGNQEADMSGPTRDPSVQ